MASITSTGIGSGLDVNTIVTQLVALEKRPLTLLQNEKSELNTQLSSFGRLQSLTSSLRDAANSLTSTTLWSGTTATSSNTAAVTATTSTGAASGNYSVNVTRLAAGQTASSRAFTAGTAVVGTGTLTIELGTWTGDPSVTGFTAKTGVTAKTITLGEGEDTLEKIRDKINATADVGVTASIINDASGARLALRSTTTGAENGFRVTAAETVDDGVASTGLSALAFNAASATSPMTLNQRAVNAAATVNGISITSASNTLTNVADGLTLQLLNTTPSAAADVTVKQDTASVKKSIESFVAAFNDLANFMREQTKYDETSKKAGALQGDRVVGTLRSELRAALNLPNSASSKFDTLSSIGIAMKSDGTLEIKGTKIEGALGDMVELKKLLVQTGEVPANTGFIKRFKDLADAFLSSEGSIEARNASLRQRIARNDKSQADMQLRIDKTEQRIRAQYQALDAKMSSLSGLSSYVSQQMNLLNNN